MYYMRFDNILIILNISMIVKLTNQEVFDIKIFVKPHGLTIECGSGDTLIAALEGGGIPPHAFCGGKGKCKKCGVRIVSGDVSDITEEERACFSGAELAAGDRLSCLTRVLSDVTVEVADGGGLSKFMNKLVFPRDFPKNADIKRVDVALGEAVKGGKIGKEQAVLSAAKGAARITMRALRQLSGIRANTGEVTASISGDAVIDIAARDSERPLYGVAADVGTTSVSCMLWDLLSGQLVGIASRGNPQAPHGADVISRIEFAIRSRADLAEMQRLIACCLNEMIDGLCAENGIERAYICKAAVASNPTMNHLLLGIDPHSLAVLPYVPTMSLPRRVHPADIGLTIDAEVYMLPNIACHVGSDMTGVLAATKPGDIDGVSMALDIGTNGEIALAGGGDIYVCSAAAGPAFEGMNICHGMRAAQGAVERFWIDEDDVRLKTIGDAAPVGICGSGLIDIIASLLGAGVIKKTGKFVSGEELERLPDRLKNRIRRDSGGVYFLVAEGLREVILRQKDVREVQLAKSAIRVGIDTLLRRAGAAAGDIKSFFIAGAFGSYIDIPNAIKIGLLPGIPLEKYISVGNAAAVGAGMALLCEKQRLYAENAAARAEHVELSQDIHFNDSFVENMHF